VGEKARSFFILTGWKGRVLRQEKKKYKEF
jgi:hypothetical protein